MTTHEFALSDLAARLAGTDASLRMSLRDILTVALQELTEAELTATIGAAPGERCADRVTQRNGHRPKLVSTRPVMSSSITATLVWALQMRIRRADRALYAVIGLRPHQIGLLSALEFSLVWIVATLVSALGAALATMATHDRSGFAVITATIGAARVTVLTGLLGMAAGWYSSHRSTASVTTALKDR